MQPEKHSDVTRTVILYKYILQRGTFKRNTFGISSLAQLLDIQVGISGLCYLIQRQEISLFLETITKIVVIKFSELIIRVQIRLL